MHSEIDTMKAKIAEARRRKQDQESKLKKREMSKIYEGITERKFKELEKEEIAEKVEASHYRTKIMVSSLAILFVSFFTFSMLRGITSDLFLHVRAAKTPFHELSSADAEFAESHKFLEALFGKGGHSETYKPGSAWQAEVPEAISGDVEEMLKTLYGRSFAITAVNGSADGSFYSAACMFQGFGSVSVNFRKSARGFHLLSLEYI